MTKKGKSQDVSHSNEDVRTSTNSCNIPSGHKTTPFSEHNHKENHQKNIDSKIQSHTSYQTENHEKFINNSKSIKKQPNNIQPSTTNTYDKPSDEPFKQGKSTLKKNQNQMQYIAHQTPQSVEKKKNTARASSSDSDSSDDEQPVSKKPAIAKASPVVGKPAVSMVGGKKVVGKPASSSSDSDSSDDGGAVAVKRPVVAAGKPLSSGVPQTTPQSVQKKKVAAAASSSDSDSSDDEQPVSKKPAIVKASPVVGKPAVSMVGGKKVVGKPASSSSDSDSSDDGGAVAVKKPVVAAGKPLSSGVPQTTPQSVQKKKAVGDCGDTSVDHTASGPRVSFVCPVSLDSPMESVSVRNGGVNHRKRAYSYGEDSDKLNGSANKSCDTSMNRSDTSLTSLTPDSARKFRAGSTPFRRVVEDEVFVHPSLRDNSFDAKRNSHGSWGEKANRDFKFTSGKVFKQEKTKKKRGSYVGGSLSTVPCSFKFDDE